MAMKPSSTAEPTILLTIEDVAHHCRVSQRTIRRWIERGELVAHRLGRQWRIVRKDLEAFIKIRRCA